ncbi:MULTISPECIES: 50S ribosomal protein L18 [Methanobacterium]|jgi:large subunit ribosomal protein L18|uniref:Large ribosomal subunit protein uL18 n=1 Tax=Methanobacterium subterraneum TaxID=59277 RepID=A0A2H4VD86_9EURY|nr:MULTISPECIES: 50S ribosomal protein L18 [Methanobacterium]AUB56068.1 50S ribosomal protein L18 [Methanobacterium subterraneum]AUB56901.1 50S ribosomal protein L18 [Methanobacterium sp. MZ-A1]NMO08616.1 50S ribosomal protein L18 [Methanobacterium subterraneum]
MAKGSRYKVAFKRRREGKTDYGARLKLIGLDKHRLVVRVTGNHTIAQIVDVQMEGDETLVSAHSQELKNMGWLASGKNTSAAYLTGYLCGKKAIKEGIGGAVLDMGLATSIKGSRIYAVLKGAIDAGLDVPHKDVILPSEDRITGEHIAQYAQSLEKAEMEKKFSQYIQRGLKPMELPDHFQSIKEKIEKEVS